jgi:hypothetical protein
MDEKKFFEYEKPGLINLYVPPVDGLCVVGDSNFAGACVGGTTPASTCCFAGQTPN